jgi:hypothetical protein
LYCNWSQKRRAPGIDLVEERRELGQRRVDDHLDRTDGVVCRDQLVWGDRQHHLGLPRRFASHR